METRLRDEVDDRFITATVNELERVVDTTAVPAVIRWIIRSSERSSMCGDAVGRSKTTTREFVNM